jgi:hypothetical protein
LATAITSGNGFCMSRPNSTCFRSSATCLLGILVSTEILQEGQSLLSYCISDPGVPYCLQKQRRSTWSICYTFVSTWICGQRQGSLDFQSIRFSATYACFAWRIGIPRRRSQSTTNSPSSVDSACSQFPSEFPSNHGLLHHMAPVAQYIRGIASSLGTQRIHAQLIYDALRAELKQFDGDSIFDDKDFTKSTLYR